MKRRLLAIGLILGVSTIVFAQGDPVAVRKEMMGVLSDHAWDAFRKMLKGEQAYEQAKVDTGFSQMIDAAGKLPALFPAGTEGATRSGSRYIASPKIWENKSDFDARIAKFSKDLAAAKPKATSLEGLKQAMPDVLKNCDTCHDLYRVRK
jgi:cytochrome c556